MPKLVPGAFGFGMDSRAAYGDVSSPTILRVTNLNDTGAGSLRAALTATGARVVIFEVSGYIDLTTAVAITSPYLTVAGQTAPSPGITVRMVQVFNNYAAIECATHDVLFQHFRIRPGSVGCNSGFQFTGGSSNYNIVLDHMSVSWGQDENMALGSPTDLTVWRSWTTEALFQVPGSGGCTGGGLSDGAGLGFGTGTRISVIQSLLAKNTTRNPQEANFSSVYLNNLLYDWVGHGMMFTNDVAGGSSNPWQKTVAGNKWIVGSHTNDPGFPGGSMITYINNGTFPQRLGNQIYRSDNLLDGASYPATSVVAEYNALTYNPNVGSPPPNAPIPAGYTVVAASTVETLVLDTAGARPLDRDAVDTRVRTEVLNRTGVRPSVVADVGGYPALAQNTRTLTTPIDPHLVTGSGYTNLEVWLHDYATQLEAGVPLPPSLAPTFCEPGTDATADLSFYRGTQPAGTGTIATATDFSVTGPRSIKAVNTVVGDGNLVLTPLSVVSDAGSAFSVWFRLSSTTPSTATGLVAVLQDVGATLLRVGVDPTGKLRIDGRGATSRLGSTLLAPATWYRLSGGFVITSSTNWSFKIYLNGALEAVTTNADGTLQFTGAGQLCLGILTFEGANTPWTSTSVLTVWFDNVYIDNRTTQDDPGAIQVTAKRPVANGTTNGLTTQIGSGGSGYGTGHAPQVNERPLSQTNGWELAGAGSAVTEEYNIETQAAGDVDLTGATLQNKMGWVFAKSLAAETGSIIVNGNTSAIALTSTPTMFTKIGAAGYPAGTGADIGLVTSTDLTTVSLYDCGVLIPFIVPPPVPPPPPNPPPPKPTPLPIPASYSHPHGPTSTTATQPRTSSFPKTGGAVGSCVTPPEFEAWLHDWYLRWISGAPYQP